MPQHKSSNNLTVVVESDTAADFAVAVDHEIKMGYFVMNISVCPRVDGKGYHHIALMEKVLNEFKPQHIVKPKVLDS